ncbi:signal recognition particle-docking protein FtsY [Modicisalibacter coralii]|uniref:signal recognition particle-docking protein FtsY n=1 Tax=Modicisalibacter coralii TaxID=2304602 RepID=UPI00100A5E9F|nr:signal recognition particle-docking protein FtsY [Halomonas coralii]
MFGFFKRKKTQQDPAARDDAREASVDETEVEEAAERGESDAAEAPVHEVDPQREPAAAYSPDTLEQTAAREALDGDVATGEARSALDETPAVAPGDPAAPDDAEAPGRETETETVESVEVSEPAQANDDDAPEADHATAGRDKPRGEKKGWLARIRAGLGKTRANLTEGLADLFLGKKQIDDDLMEDLETQLLMADVGIEATTEIIDNLTERVSRKELKDPQALFQALQEELTTLLAPVTTPLALPPKGEGPFVILMVGVNGVGKTTTIGKLTQRFQNEGRSVMLAAGDTFRAAAVEQLKVWGERNRVPVIAQHTGADSASVIYDALAAAKARGVDVLIADTAGRLHNKSHLMEELKKVQRVMAKLDAQAPHEVMLVLDAGTGQNALSQAQTFNEAIPVTGITLTKLDGTAKGGIIFALAKQLATPIRFIGVGETLDDLRPFAAEDFVTALFDRDASAES